MASRKRRRFGLPVREATEPLTLKLLQVDIDKANAVKGSDVNDKDNFMTCVIAQAATRAFGAKQAMIMRRTAYVAFPGDRCTRRYLVDQKSHDTLAAWDRGERVVEGIELRLRPPEGQRTLTRMRKASARYRKNNEGAKKPLTNRKQRAADPLAGTVRNGNLVRWS